MICDCAVMAIQSLTAASMFRSEWTEWKASGTGLPSFLYHGSLQRQSLSAFQSTEVLPLCLKHVLEVGLLICLAVLFSESKLIKSHQDLLVQRYFYFLMNRNLLRGGMVLMYFLFNMRNGRTM